MIAYAALKADSSSYGHSESNLGETLCSDQHHKLMVGLDAVTLGMCSTTSSHAKLGRFKLKHEGGKWALLT